ncbi:MAG: tetratricopeptide repeat protein [Candidatus Aminicenantes bacterium]|nr:tetratricopeptide repeat protein [Candidatus Aminicenantes bacterium]
MKPTIFTGWLVLIACAFVLPGLGAQNAQEREAQAATFLVQADDAYARGDYQKAAADYLLVVQVSGNKMNLSRAHMGLSLCHFYLNDVENAKKHILKTLEIDPQKEVSPLFHPQTYVDLFNEVKQENKGRLALAAVPAPAVAPLQTKAQPQAGLEQQVIPEGVLEEEGGYFEIGIHSSLWSVDPVKGAFEDTLTKKAANEIRENLTDTLNESNDGNLAPSDDEQSLAFSSEGYNIGFEVRYYPLGRSGSMSVGLSLEKTKIKLSMKGPVTQRYADGSVATVEGDAYAEISPLSANISFRWDILPSWRITPYVVLGVGLGPLNGTAAYVYSGTYRRGNDQAGVSGEETKTFDDLREEEEIDLDRFILLHSAIGVKGRVYKDLILKGEVGFWDGLILRAGVAYRF